MSAWQMRASASPEPALAVGDPDRCPDIDLPAVDLERLAERLENPVRRVDGVQGPGAVQDDGELVPAEASDRVVIPQRGVEPLADLYKEEVADVVA